MTDIMFREAGAVDRPLWDKMTVLGDVARKAWKER